MILDIRDDYDSYQRNLQVLVKYLRVYENKKRIESRGMFKFYRLTLQNGGVLTDGMIEHIMRFLKYDLDQSVQDIKTVMDRFKSKPKPPVTTGVTLDQFING